MSEWPPGVTVKPIVQWPGEPTRSRRSSDFSAPWSTTLKGLWRELRALKASNVVLQVAVREQDFRIDGYPRVHARPEHPGVILTFGSKHGPLSYPCDTFRDWKDNLRAIVLAMEALRRVDRYGVTRSGEQYAGWKALPSGSDGPVRFASADEAIQWMAERCRSLGFDPPGTNPRLLYRYLARQLHPDMSGDRIGWDFLDQARQLLEAARLL